MILQSFLFLLHLLHHATLGNVIVAKLEWMDNIYIQHQKHGSIFWRKHLCLDSLYIFVYCKLRETWWTQNIRIDSTFRRLPFIMITNTKSIHLTPLKLSFMKHTYNKKWKWLSNVFANTDISSDIPNEKVIHCQWKT